MNKASSSRLVLLLILFSACSGARETDDRGVGDGIIVAELQDSGVQPVMSDERLKFVVRTAFAANDPVHADLESAWVEGSGEHYYLIADGVYPDGNDKKVAIELRKVKDRKSQLLVWDR